MTMQEKCIACGFSGSRDDCDVERSEGYTAYLCPNCSAVLEYHWKEGSDDGYAFTL